MRGVKWGVGVGAWAFGEGTKKRAAREVGGAGPSNPSPPPLERPSPPRSHRRPGASLFFPTAFHTHTHTHTHAHHRTHTHTHSHSPPPHTPLSYPPPELFDDRTAQLTVLAPTNDAWVKRLPSLTAAANLTLPQLLSDGRARVMEQVINYHVLPGRPVDSLDQLGLRGRLSTNANSCSTAKNVEVAAVQPAGDSAGQVTLASSLGGTARTAGPPGRVAGGSTIFPIDDVLLPASVTLPFEAALAGPADLATSAVDPATLAALSAAVEGKEPLPLTDDTGLAARDKAALGANSVPVGGGGGDGGGGGGGGESPPSPPPARRRVTIPTLPPAEDQQAGVDTPPAVMGGRPTPVVP